jgi:hypothetical protein
VSDRSGSSCTASTIMMCSAPSIPRTSRICAGSGSTHLKVVDKMDTLLISAVKEPRVKTSPARPGRCRPRWSGGRTSRGKSAMP